MRKLLLILFFSGLSTQVKADPDKEAYKACLPAADFQGCIKAFKKSLIKTSSLKDYDNDKFDFLGLPIPENWIKSDDKAKLTINYIDPSSVSKVKVRNTFGRYISYRGITRWYKNPKAGTKGTFKSGLGTSSTNCSIYGDKANCKTTSFPSGKYIAGEPLDPGGVRQQDITYLIDCLTRRHFYKGDWYSIENSIPRAIANNYCSKIDSLPISSITKYENGSPSEKDKIALEVLPNSNPEDIKIKFGIKD